MSIFAKLRSFLHKEKLDADMVEEMRQHVERRTAANLAAGMSDDEARYAALRHFGGLEQIKEIAREQRGGFWLEQMGRDASFALRQLRKHPGFTAVAVLSLALGIGASTAVFSIFNGVLLRSLPVPNPHQLRELHWTAKESRISSIEGVGTVPPPVFLALREQGREQADIFGHAPIENVIARAKGAAFTARGAMVSDNFFSSIGAQAFLGRGLAPGDDFAGGGTSVVLGIELWTKHFAADPNAVGQVLVLNGRSFTVVGVMPRGFVGVQAGQPADFYVPLCAASPFLYVEYTSRFHWFVRLMARLKSGATDEQLGARLDVALAGEVGDAMKEPRLVIEPGHAGSALDGPAYRKPLLSMSAVVALVMLIACANLAGLSLARGAARRHELSVRAALGAGRGRLIRQSLTESMVLAVMGGGLALPIAFWIRAGMAQLLAGSADGLQYDLSRDFTVLGFATALAFVTALLSGLLPAWRAGQADPLGGLKSHGALNAPRLRAGRVLVALQIGLSLLLLAGAGLYLRTLMKLATVDAGFRVEKILLFQLHLRGSGAADAQPAAFYERVQTALAAIPGVTEASLIEFPLLSGASSSGSVEAISGRPLDTPQRGATRRLRVGETFFATFGVPVVQGRGFNGADGIAAPKVVVVNEAFVRKFLPNENPLGHTLKMWDADWEIVGVSRDAKMNSLRQIAPPTTYFPFTQMFYSRFKTTHLRSAYFAVKTVVPADAVMPAVRRAVAAIDAGVALNNVTTQENVRDRSIGQERLFATLCAALAALGLLLACIGLYGLMAFNVARRTSEFAIRLALGARPPEIARSVVREALLLSIGGIGIGLGGAFGLTRLIANQLYGIDPHDPLTFAVASVALVGVAVLAAWIPARRAMNVNPMVALRTE